MILERKYLNIKKRNPVTNLPLPSSQSSIVSHYPLSLFTLFTRQRFLNGCIQQKNQPISRDLRVYQHHDSVICIALTSYICVSKGFVLIKKVETTHPVMLMLVFYFTLSICVTSDPLKPDLSSSKIRLF